MSSPKKQKLLVAYKFWPSCLTRAGHTTVELTDAKDPLFQFLEDFQRREQKDPPFPNMVVGRRVQNVPCHLRESSKFRHGPNRWWCDVHQGQYGTKGHLEVFAKTQQQRSEYADEPVDFCRAADIPTFVLGKQQLAATDTTQKENEQVAVLDDPKSPTALKTTSSDSAEVDAKPSPTQNNEYAELSITMSLPPARTWEAGVELKPGDKTATFYYPNFRVQARQTPSGPIVLDQHFPAVNVCDRTGRYPHLLGKGVLVTPPAALEFLYHLEHRCPVRKQRQEENGATIALLAKHRRKVELKRDVQCKHCGAFHEDIGNHFGQELHVKHRCGQCGRDIFNAGRATNIGNPLLALKSPLKIRRTPSETVLKLDSAQYDRIRLTPSTPALFWTNNDRAEDWGIHVRAESADSTSSINGVYGQVWLDGKQLDRFELFQQMIQNTKWLETKELVNDASLNTVEAIF